MTPATGPSANLWGANRERQRGWIRTACRLRYQTTRRFRDQTASAVIRVTVIVAMCFQELRNYIRQWKEEYMIPIFPCK